MQHSSSCKNCGCGSVNKVIQQRLFEKQELSHTGITGNFKRTYGRMKSFSSLLSIYAEEKYRQTHDPLARNITHCNGQDVLERSDRMRNEGEKLGHTDMFLVLYESYESKIWSLVLTTWKRVCRIDRNDNRRTKKQIQKSKIFLVGIDKSSIYSQHHNILGNPSHTQIV